MNHKTFFRRPIEASIELDDLKAEILGAYHEACQGFSDVREALREDAAEFRRGA